MAKDELQKRLEIIERQHAELLEWKRKCDRAALKWGSFAMGFLTMGALFVTGMDSLKEKWGKILAIWAER